MADYVAQHRIYQPGTYALGYDTGDPITEQVVADWALGVPDDVVAADGYQAPRPRDDDDSRAAWEAYVVGQGTDLEDARAASLDELREMYPPPPPPAHDLPASVSAEGVDGTGYQNATPVSADNIPSAPTGPERPSTTALKSEWVDYVIASGGREVWARDPDTTKADLMAWSPED